MSFYTAVANSWAELAAGIVSACTAAGWSVDASGLILSKSGIYIRLIPDAVYGIRIQGGDGISGSALTNPSAIRPRMGKPSIYGIADTWPMVFFVHVNETPDEVFVIARFNVDYYYWCCWGVSKIPLSGTGLWLSASSRDQPGGFLGQDGMVLSPTTGGIANDRKSVGMPFWDTVRYSTNALCQDTIHSIDNAWCNVGTTLNAVAYAAPRVEVSPNAWNAESILIPIQVFQGRPSGFVSMVCDIAHARYVRTDYYDPEQVVSIGSTRWKVYPGYRKNSASRDTGGYHTGTFGFACRYDGP